MTRPMTAAERDAFLQVPRPAILSVPVPGRAPLSSPVWFDRDPGGAIWIVMQANSRKGRLIEPGTPVSLCVQKQERPYQYVTVEGQVTEIRPYDLDTDLRQMAERYLGPEGGAEFVEAMRPTYAKGNGIKVTFAPQHWLSADYGQD